LKRLRKLKPGIVPKSLKIWFVIHFAVDVIFAIPLMIVPQLFLSALGWKTIDPIASRLVAAALFAIGVESLLSTKAPLHTYVGLLNLKIIWSTTAVAGTAISLMVLGSEGPQLAWGIVGIFFVFAAIWTYWRIRIDE
jgi:hypothetical protein